jgi:hypothetical protein
LADIDEYVSNKFETPCKSGVEPKSRPSAEVDGHFVGGVGDMTRFKRAAPREPLALFDH